MTAPFPHRPDIDGLRALAILPVMLFHLGVAGFGGGFVGVDIFFVISGYLITAIIHREMVEGRFSFPAFFERRVRRIVPALILVLIVSAVAASVLLLPYDLIEFGRSLAASALGLVNIRFLEGFGYFAGPSLTKPLLHIWSLSLEEQFYLVFPLLLWLLLRYAKGGVRFGLGILALASFGLGMWVVGGWPKGAFYLPVFRAWEFLVGALLALGALPALEGKTQRDWVGGVGLVLILGSVFLLDDLTPFPGWRALVPVVGAGLILHAGAGGGYRGGRALSWRPLVFVGLISYSLYLWHWPLLVFTRYVTLQPPGVGQQAAILVAAFVLAAATWRWVERPFRGKSGVLTRRVLLGFAAGAAALLVAVAVSVEVGGGFPQRVTQRVIDLQHEALPPTPWRGYVRKLFPEARAFWGAKHRQQSSPAPKFKYEAFGAGSRIAFGGEEEPPRIVVWGDSHAGNLLAPFEALPDPLIHGLTILEMSGCAPLLGTGSSEGSDGARCLAFNRKVADWIRATPSIQRVVLTAHWGFYTEPTRYREAPLRPSPLVPGADTADNPRLFQNGLEQTARFFTEHGAEVIWLADNPDPGFDVPRLMARAESWGGDLPSGPTHFEHLERQEPLFQGLQTLSSRFPVHLVDPTPLLCPGEICPVEQGGEPLYRDDNHLSRLGLTLIAPLLERLLDRGGNPPP